MFQTGTGTPDWRRILAPAWPQTPQPPGAALRRAQTAGYRGHIRSSSGVEAMLQLLRLRLLRNNRDHVGKLANALHACNNRCQWAGWWKQSVTQVDR